MRCVAEAATRNMNMGIIDIIVTDPYYMVYRFGMYIDKLGLALYIKSTLYAQV